MDIEEADRILHDLLLDAQKTAAKAMSNSRGQSLEQK